MTTQSSAEKRFTMPGEWEPHRSTLLAWPHNREDWPGRFEPIPWVYGEIIRQLTKHERVRLVIRHDKDEAEVRDKLGRAGVDLAQIDFHRIRTNRIWMRDAGPIWVCDESGKPTLVEFAFNAWAKYPNHLLDKSLKKGLNDALQLPIVQPRHKGRHVVLEGGAIDVNGKGTLITTEECLLSEIQCRNPGFSRDDYAQVFAQYLGIDDVIWLGDGIVGDDTHGHVDDITRFVNETTIVTVVESNAKDDNHARLQDNLRRLKRTKFDVIELPMPAELRFEDTRLPASYANFYIANGVVLVPTFNDRNDRLALNILAEAFPDREIIGIHCVDFVWGLGTLHCMSQQEPAF